MCNKGKLILHTELSRRNYSFYYYFFYILLLHLLVFVFVYILSSTKDYYDSIILPHSVAFPYHINPMMCVFLSKFFLFSPADSLYKIYINYTRPLIWVDNGTMTRMHLGL